MNASWAARLRVAVALPRASLHLVWGVLVIALLFPLASERGRRAHVRRWSRRLLAVLGVRLRVVDARPRDDRAAVIDAVVRLEGRGAMLVLNHISWADIFVVHALRTAHFVAKSEIARWPVIGFLTARTGTVFIERGRRHGVREANQRVARLLAGGELVAMFPEGVTGDGDRLLPFHANLIQPAIDARVPIVVAGLRYRDARGRATTAPSYAGDINLLQAVVRTVAAGPVTAELHLVDAIDGGAVTRHAAAQRAHDAIAAALGFDDEDEELLESLSTIVVADDGDRAPVSRGAAPAHCHGHRPPAPAGRRRSAHG